MLIEGSTLCICNGEWRWKKEVLVDRDHLGECTLSCWKATIFLVLKPNKQDLMPALCLLPSFLFLWRSLWMNHDTIGIEKGLDKVAWVWNNVLFQFHLLNLFQTKQTKHYPKICVFIQWDNDVDFWWISMEIRAKGISSNDAVIVVILFTLK